MLRALNHITFWLQLLAQKTTAEAAALIALLLVFSALTGCRTGPAHPPTFADFQRASRQDAGTNFDAQIAFFAAAQLSDHELQRLLTRGNTEELVGAGTETHLLNPLGRMLLVRATEKSPASPVVWAALAYRHISLLANQMAGLPAEPIPGELASAINHWRALEPTNAAPLYLEAALQCLRTSVAAAKQLMAEADRIESFDSYTTAIQKCVILAMESAGRSHYTARIYALGQTVGIVGWSKLNRSILAASSEDEPAVRSCFILGGRIGLGKSLIEQAIGDNIQSRALAKLTSADVAAEKTRLSDRKALMKLAIAYSHSLDSRKISEERWISFLDRCFDQGELTALESFAAENGDTF